MTKETEPPGTRHQGKAARETKSGGLVRANLHQVGRDVVRRARRRPPAHHLHPARRPPTETYRTQTAQFEGLGSRQRPPRASHAVGCLFRHLHLGGTARTEAAVPLRALCQRQQPMGTGRPGRAQFWFLTVTEIVKKIMCSKREGAHFVNPNRFGRRKSGVAMRTLFLQAQQNSRAIGRLASTSCLFRVHWP
jgi:hypothetical protein